MSNSLSRLIATSLSRLGKASLPGAIGWIQKPGVFCVMVVALLFMAVAGNQAWEQGSYLLAAAWCLVPAGVVAYLIFSGLRLSYMGLHSFWKRPRTFALILGVHHNRCAYPALRAFALARARDSIP